MRGKVRLKDHFPESSIVKIWQHQLLDRTELLTEEGEPIKIVYPGRINDDRGADMLDAVVATGQGLIKGDIEIHVKSSGWRAHRHHQDPTYNRVILHVVFWRDTEVTTSLQNGGRVPTLALHKYIKSPTYQWINSAHPSGNWGIPCHKAIQRLNTGFIREFLDSAGEERFLAKAARFQADLAQMEASQSLYQEIMVALGYTKNKLPFLKLARSLPLQTLESMAQGKRADEECLAQQQALLIGTAGLLPSQRSNWQLVGKSDDEWADKLEKLWASSHQNQAMSENDWHLFKVRPNNFPTRRIAAMSYLILRYREKGILEEVIGRLMEIPAGTGHHGLEEALLVTTDGYWASHFDSGYPSRLRIPTLLGAGRAADIVVNVLLPFAYAQGILSSQPGLTKKAFELYHRYPRLAVNAVERHMRNQLGLSSDLVDSAQRQQGLIHIYRTLCSQGECHHCPLGTG